ncbi:MAG: hypothetical protein CGU28_04760 [Candidatus Dactylopiibacterium carminicum]|uniref:Uncharacterized protein n=1 Tax=Candidatus Dactylopiibacterium carminicum TaxID=857335 RepID=A0A272EUC5_9RHOO|nr:hypothetical protein [Candidatus Dactylopiibacterium carminicum]KAF7599710.1 hypothetical protein BGI27_06390 [Candidatus Dactylopiibacterium carminicum]PAS93646.1 MAG: hypothetical protein CGU29_06830 [Candidatus Dactylopiibacterium carminicum]PAS97513.1 MAG: hypothetical protein CGU28_04760 [Candidatus Dactylopiibacterium carminicum]PAS99711.1 MAG: hypothetical protein BSR46_06425 [Candidatus Dactylopiibacterium carminicum]
MLKEIQMDGLVFTKTPAGVEEIQLRRLRLHPRARSLLIMIDGCRSVFDLVSTLSGVGIGYEDQQHFQHLQIAGLIEQKADAIPVSMVPPVMEAPISEAVATTLMGDEDARFQALQKLYAEVAREHFPQRARAFQKQLNKADCLREYIRLGNEIIVALNQTQRAEHAAAFKARVKPLLR